MSVTIKIKHREDGVVQKQFPLHPHDINGVLHNMFLKSIYCYKHKIEIAAENNHDCLFEVQIWMVIGIVASILEPEELKSLCVMDSDSVFT